MTLKHGPSKRGQSEMRDRPVLRTTSMKLSPPKKKTKEGPNEEEVNRKIVAKDLDIKSLETKNYNLNQVDKQNQEDLTKQASIIEELREKIKEYEDQKDKKNAETANENEVYILKQTIEAANRKIFACESD